MPINQIQRDLGRVEAKVEIMTSDLKTIKDDLDEIKGSLSTTKAVKEFRWSTLLFVGTAASIITQILNWVKPLFT